MSAVLVQISVAIGGLAFVLSLALCTIRGIPIMTAIFRGAIVMCLVTLCVGVFFRFFTSILYGFVKQKVLEKAAEHAEDSESEEGDNEPEAEPVPEEDEPKV